MALSRSYNKNMNELLPQISNLFRTYGIKSLTIKDIVMKLGISKNAFNVHFKNKEDVILKLAYSEIGKESDELNNLCIKHQHVIDQLYAISKYVVQKENELNSLLIYSMKKYYPEIWDNAMNIRKKNVINVITNNFNIGVKQGIYRKSIDLIVVVLFSDFLLNIRSIEMNKDWLINNFDNTFDIIFLYHIRSIANKEGIEYSEEKLNCQNF
ncbi:MAG: hypothetical protein A2X12_09845 [Bacteroidetes bacterium GWE2_29_8]|nr:MAG: hypothetical protein A2X12_09845 [Bacteroidetes bacterium GWE2_29_8]